MESIRQKQLSSDIQRIMGRLLQQDLRDLLQGTFVTVSSVSITPDLLIARIFLSVLQTDKEESVLNNLREYNKRIRGKLGNELKNKVRRIPEIEFHLDKSLDQVFRIEELLRKDKLRNQEEE